MRPRRIAVAITVAVVAALTPASVAHGFTFVSAPDTWNADIGTVQAASGWAPGEPDSIDPAWQQATNAVLARFAAHRPAFVLVAGDLVNGHWYVSSAPYDTFGAVTNVATARRAVTEAAGIYYPAWLAAFRAHGLSVFPAIGDHDIGDDPWSNPMRRKLVPTYRAAWARAFTGGFTLHPRAGTQHARTAYAFARPPVMFISVDVFHARRDGSIHVEVVGEQLRWLRRVLRAASADPAIHFIVVQGHAPALPPHHRFHSSGLHIEGGAASPFWRTLEAAHVTLYLTGEYHVLDVASAGGITQITHGSILGRDAFNYIAVSVTAKRMKVRMYSAHVSHTGADRLWQVDGKRPYAHPVVGGFHRSGKVLVIRARGRRRPRRSAPRRSRAG
jgi:hypothetical protein